MLGFKLNHVIRWGSGQKDRLLVDALFQCRKFAVWLAFAAPCSWWSNLQVTIYSGGDVASNRRPAITWTNDDAIKWRHMCVIELTFMWANVTREEHDDVIKWKHFPRYWPFVRGIHRSPVNSPHKGQWRGALMFSLICIWINGWVNNREAGDLRRYRAHYDVTEMNEANFNSCILHW